MGSVSLADILNPPKQQDSMTDYLRTQGYIAVKRLPDGSYAAMMPLITTTAICLGVREHVWTRRFCYSTFADALHNWMQLTSKDDEPTGWVARRPE